MKPKDGCKFCNQLWPDHQPLEIIVAKKSLWQRLKLAWLFAVKHPPYKIIVQISDGPSDGECVACEVK